MNEATIQNAKRDGVNITERPQGSQSAGSIQPAPPGRFVDVLVRLKPRVTYEATPLRYELILNANYSTEVAVCHAGARTRAPLLRAPRLGQCQLVAEQGRIVACGMRI